MWLRPECLPPVPQHSRKRLPTGPMLPVKSALQHAPGASTRVRKLAQQALCPPSSPVPWPLSPQPGTNGREWKRSSHCHWSPSPAGSPQRRPLGLLTSWHAHPPFPNTYLGDIERGSPELHGIGGSGFLLAGRLLYLRGHEEEMNVESGDARVAGGGWGTLELPARLESTMGIPVRWELSPDGAGGGGCRAW